jgi:hypothetical protein
MLAATATVATTLALAVLITSQAYSQPRSLDVALYTPIGVAQTPSGTHTVAWVLDTTNRRVVMCSQKISELTTSKIDCRAGDLPNP